MMAVLLLLVPRNVMRFCNNCSEKDFLCSLNDHSDTNIIFYIGTKLLRVVKLLPYIIDTLEAIKDSGAYRSDWNQASSLLHSCSSFQFICTPHTTREVMNATKDLCKKLQGLRLYTCSRNIV